MTFDDPISGPDEYPEAPSDPNPDVMLVEPGDGWPRGRDTTLSLLLNQRERLMAAVRYMLTTFGEERGRALSHAGRVLQDIEQEKERQR